MDAARIPLVLRLLDGTLDDAPARFVWTAWQVPLRPRTSSAFFLPPWRLALPTGPLLPQLWSQMEPHVGALNQKKSPGPKQ